MTFLCPQQFNLPADVKNLFAVEVMLDHPKPTKDHIVCNTGDVLFVLLIAHEKMSPEKYLIEKEDGTSECILYIIVMFQSFLLK